MIENYFTKFNTSSEYNTYKESSGYTVPNVSWVVNENKMESETWIPPLTSGIVIYKNGRFREVSYEDFDAHYDDIISRGYSIEGVIAVPGSHTLDGTTRIMSLVNMSCSSPDTGTTSSGDTMCWGHEGRRLSGLTEYDYPAMVSNMPDETTISATPTASFIPSDNSACTGVQCVVDSKAKYCREASYSSRYAPSPYITGDEPNPLYRIKEIALNSKYYLNAFSDFEGRENTEIIIANATAQSDWCTASTITNSSSTGYFPAACCCKRYGTSGIPSGNWYLPAMGELGYVVARSGSIDELLELIGIKDQRINVSQIPDKRLVTSTITTNSSYVFNSFLDKTYSTYGAASSDSYRSSSFTVRAFAAIHATPLTF